jgi:hypothetical protein
MVIVAPLTKPVPVVAQCHRQSAPLYEDGGNGRAAGKWVNEGRTGATLISVGDNNVNIQLHVLLGYRGE